MKTKKIKPISTRTVSHEWSIIDWTKAGGGSQLETGETFATRDAAQAWCASRNSLTGYPRYEVVYMPPSLPYETTSPFYSLVV